MDERPSLVDAALLNPFKDGPTRIRRALKPHNLRRWIGRGAEGVALAALFLVGTTAGLVLHLDTGESRRVTANAVNHLLEPVLRGRIIVGEIDELSLRHARIRSARILDQNGDQVIHAQGIDARVQTVRLVRALFLEDEEIPLVFPRARIEHANVTLRPGDDGIPTIAWAFFPKDLTPSVVPPRPVVVHLPQIEIDEAHVDGSVGAPIAADVERVSASVYVRTDERVTVDVEETGVRVRELLPGETSGLGSFHLRVDLTPPPPVLQAGTVDRVVLWSEFSGSMRPLDGAAVAPIEVSAEATMTDGILDGVVRVPRMKRESREALFPFLPIQRDLRGYATVAGPVTNLSLEGSFEVEQPEGTATVVATGGIAVKDDVRLQLTLSAAELDARTIVDAAPSVLVDGQAEVTVRMPRGEEPLVHVDASTEPTIFAGERLPRVDAVIDVVRGGIVGSVSIDEPELAVRGSFDLHDDRARFHAHADSEDLSKLPWLDGFARGKGAVWLTGSYADGEVDGAVRGNAIGFSTKDGSVSAGQVGFSGTVVGPPVRPRVKARLFADDTRALGEQLDRVIITVDGDALEPAFTVGVNDRDRGELTVRGVASLLDRRARGLSFEVSRAGEEARGRVGEVAVLDGGFVLEDLDLASPTLGSLGGSVRLQRDEVIGDLRGADVDLTRLGKLLGVTLPVDGRANLAIVVRKTPEGREGTIDVELEDARVLLLSGVGLRLSAELDGERVKAAGYVRLVDHATPGARIAAGSDRQSAPLCDGTIVELRAADLDGQLRGPLLDADTWRRATGSVDVRFDTAELHCLAERVPKFLRPVARARGEVSGGFKLARATGDAYPSVAGFHLSTDRLELMANGGEVGSDALDLAVTADLDGDTGELVAHGTVFDQRALLSAELKASLDLAALETQEDTWAVLETTPVNLTVGMPTRSLSTLSSLPYPLRDALPDLEGDVALLGTLGGTIDSPVLNVGAQAFNVRASQAGRIDQDWLPQLTMDASATYDPTRGRALVGVSVGVARLPVAVFGAQIDVDKAVLSGKKPLEEAPWRGDAVAEFYELPLHAVPALSDREIAGAISGKLELRNLNQNPSAKGELFVPALRIQDRFQSVLVKAEVKERGTEDETATGSAQVEITDGTEGKLQVLGTAAIDWVGLTVPTLRLDEPGTLVIGAEQFSIGIAYPLLKDFMSKLDGVLDGGATVEWGRLENAAMGAIKRAEFTLTDGVAYIDQFGQELSNGKFTVRAEPVRAGGLQDIRLEGLEATGTSGRVHGFATATMRGLSLESASGSLIIDEGEELPLTIEGVPLGKARADLAFDARPTERGVDLGVQVKSARFDLPASSTKDVQTLDEPRNITVNMPRRPAEETRAEDALQLRLSVAIEDTEVRSSSLNLNLTTPPGQPIELLLSDRLHASGEVRLDQGSIVLNKKTFEIDEAIVQLRDEEIGNPDVNLTAHWDGPDGSRVFVTYVGLLKPITEDKIKFRSDPPRSQEEIVALLVFGSSEATAASLAQDVIGGNVTTSFANDLLASAFGGVLRDVLAVDIGPSATGNAYVGAKVSVSDQFSFGGTLEQVQEAQTTTSEARAGGCGDLFFDYKISRSWSLRGSGAYCDYEDQTGATTTQDGVSLGLDVLWQLRY